MKPERRTFVVLGTGTSVGKTYFCEALARSFARLKPEAAVAAVKPIETGLIPGELSDAARLGSACFHVQPPEEHPLLGFAPPVSPHLAARRAGIEISSAQVEAWYAHYRTRCTERAPGREQLLIVETAGACFSPLSSSETNFDLALRLEPAFWILVAHDGLGVLHDLTVTLAVLRQRGRVPDCVVLSQARTPDESTGTNADELSRLGIAKPACVVGRGQSDLSALAARLLTQAAPH